MDSACMRYVGIIHDAAERWNEFIGLVIRNFERNGVCPGEQANECLQRGHGVNGIADGFETLVVEEKVERESRPSIYSALQRLPVSHPYFRRPRCQRMEK
ncbi:hypothetical protein CPB85DRAFT_1341156 [Mucidula mucida]|nr:hypothetical protein CPB85DRAFT_1341156 [Mucidula mucida]